MKNLLIVACACLCLFGCGQKQKKQQNASAVRETFTLKGSLEGLPDGTVLQLVPYAHHDEPVFAETMVNGGKFAFEGKVTEPLLVQLKMKDTYGQVMLMLENRDITVEGSAKQDGVGQGNTPIYDFSATVKGSPLTDRYKKLYSVRDSLDAVRTAFNKRYGHIISCSDPKKRAELMKTEEYKAMEKEDLEFFHTVENTFNKVILDNKDSYWGPLMMIAFTSYLTPDQKDTYEQFSDAAKNSRYGKLVYEEIYPAGKIGQAVQPFTVKGADGKEVTLQSLIAGKKYVLIDFWASWCGPCRKEIPNLKNLYGKYAAKGFDIISISIDKDNAAWQKALKEEGLKWPNFRSNEVASLYRVKAVPTMYLIDGNGVLVGLDLRGQALADKLKELFGE